MSFDVLLALVIDSNADDLGWLFDRSDKAANRIKARTLWYEQLDLAAEQEALDLLKFRGGILYPAAPPKAVNTKSEIRWYKPPHFLTPYDFFLRKVGELQMETTTTLEYSSRALEEQLNAILEQIGKRYDELDQMMEAAQKEQLELLREQDRVERALSAYRGEKPTKSTVEKVAEPIAEEKEEPKEPPKAKSKKKSSELPTISKKRENLPPEQAAERDQLKTMALAFADSEPNKGELTIPELAQLIGKPFTDKADARARFALSDAVYELLHEGKLIRLGTAWPTADRQRPDIGVGGRPAMLYKKASAREAESAKEADLTKAS